jgi:hypothetical protein
MVSDLKNGIANHNGFQDRLNSAMQRGDKISYENDSHLQHINDIILYQKLGRLDEYKSMLDQELMSTDANNKEN